MSDDPDPFAPFTQFFEQFDPAGGASAPPGMGMPFAPMSMLGQGDDLTPEDSTKRTVKQLYGTLEAMRGGTPATDTWQQYLDAAGFDASAFGPEQFSAAAVRTYRIWFYSLTQLLVETYSLRLIQEELVREAYHNDTRTQEWLWGLPQSDREELLLRCTEVAEELVTEMQTLRSRRDQLLYSFGDWESIEFDESMDDMRRVLDVLTALDDRVTEGAAFSYVPEESAAEPPTDADETASAETDASDQSESETEDSSS